MLERTRKPSAVGVRPAIGDASSPDPLEESSPEAASMTVKFSDLGISGAQPVRDLWQQKNLGSSRDQFSATVLRHGVVLVKLAK